MSNVTLHTLNTLKQKGERFAMLTAYDACFAHWVSTADVETILVGDSLGMVLQGETSTLPVTLDDMAYHTRAVAQGNQGSLIIADMPFMSYSTPELAMDSAAQLMAAGAHMVKLEGGAWLAETISMLAERGIPVCSHLGLTPQAVNKLGGYRVQGRDEESAQTMLDDAKLLEECGASMLLLECVPTELATKLTQASSVPVVGIGAGPNTDAQVLVMHDMLGLNPGRTAKFVKNFMSEGRTVQEAFKAYGDAVRDGSFPAPEHCFE